MEMAVIPLPIIQILIAVVPKPILKKLLDCGIVSHVISQFFQISVPLVHEMLAISHLIMAVLVSGAVETSGPTLEPEFERSTGKYVDLEAVGKGSNGYSTVQDYN